MPVGRLTPRLLAKRAHPGRRIASQRDDAAGAPCTACGTAIRVLRSGRLASHSPGGFTVNVARGYLRCPGSDLLPGARVQRNLDAVTVEEARARGLATRADLAARYDVNEAALRRWARMPGHPAPVGKVKTTGAMALVWEPAKVDAFYLKRIAPRLGSAQVVPGVRRRNQSGMRLVIRKPGPTVAALGLGAAANSPGGPPTAW